MMMPRFDGNLDYSEQHAHCGQKSLGALPVLLVPLHATLQIGDAPPLPSPISPVIWALSTLKSLKTCASNSFIIRIRRTPSVSFDSRLCTHDPSGRLKNSAAENLEYSVLVVPSPMW